MVFLYPILFLIFTASIVRGQRRVQETVFCLSGTRPRFIGTTQTCPCHMTAQLESSTPLDGVDLSVYALPKATFDTWVQSLLSARRNGNPIPPVPKSTMEWRDINLVRSRRQTSSYVWTSGAEQISLAGSYVLFVLGQPNDLLFSECVTANMVLEKRSETCPLRLAEPNSILRSNGAANYVVGGTKVRSNDEFNGYNALISTGEGNCTGTVIAKNYVLTAAHCRVTPGSSVRIGGTSLSDGDLYFVDTAIPHEQYIGSSNFATRIVNDIAILKLSRNIFNPTIMQLNSNTRGPDPSTIVRATGYGLIATSNLFPSRYLRMVDVPILSTEECRRRFRSNNQYRVARSIEQRHHICSGRDESCESGGVCFGDSGGPIVARMPDASLVQVGITSFGDRTCANADSADVYTRVSGYIAWIQRATGGSATTVDWKSVNNVGTSGSYGTADEVGNGLPLWTIVTIAVVASVAAVVIVLICFVYVGGRNRRNEVDDEGQQDVTDPESNQNAYPMYGHSSEVAANEIQSPPPASLVPPPPSPNAPPPPLIPYPDNSPSAPPPPLTEEIATGGTLGPRPTQ